jgi:hypothetical protein
MADMSERAKRTPQMAQKEKDGKITTSGRLALPRSKFALPPSPEEKRRGIKGRFPIDTKERARNALARASQFASSSEQETIRRAVQRTWPGIIQKAGGRK